MGRWIEFTITTVAIVVFIIVIYCRYKKTINTFKDSIAYLNKIYNLLRNVQEDKYFEFLLDYYGCNSIELSNEEMIKDILYKPYTTEEEYLVNTHINFNSPLCALDLKKKLFIYVAGDYSKEKVLIEFNFILKSFNDSYIDSNIYNIKSNGNQSFRYKSIRYAFNNFSDY